MAIGIERRDQDDDNVLQDGEDPGLVRRGQRMQQLVRRLGAADLRGMNAGADRDDCLVRRGQGPRLFRRQRPRIGQPLVRRPDPREVPDVLGSADDRGDGPVAFSRSAEVDELDAIGRRRHLLEVAIDRLRGRQLPIGAHAEPEVRLGSENGREDLRGRSRNTQRGQDRW